MYVERILEPCNRHKSTINLPNNVRTYRFAKLVVCLEPLTIFRANLLTDIWTNTLGFIRTVAALRFLQDMSDNHGA